MLRRECDSRQDSRCASVLGNPPRKASPLLEGNPTVLSPECDNGSSRYFCLEHVERVAGGLVGKLSSEWQPPMSRQHFRQRHLQCEACIAG
jgi:hypothetical protein